jgi:hypothetical protein
MSPVRVDLNPAVPDGVIATCGDEDASVDCDISGFKKPPDSPDILRYLLVTIELPAALIL